MTDAERQAALEAIASEVRACNRCRLHQGRSNAVPGEGSAATEVLFVGEGPGFNEDRQGRPFVGRAGQKLTEWIESIGWRRQDVFITNIVKCRPPDNRDPLPDEIAACTPFLRRQIEALDPSVVVTLGRFSMGWFTPGTRISQVHGTARLADPATGALEATAYAMYHPAAALRSPEVDGQAADDMVGVPTALIAARERRALTQAEPTAATTAETPAEPQALDAEPGLAATAANTSSVESRDEAGSTPDERVVAAPGVASAGALDATPTAMPDMPAPVPDEATSLAPVAAPAPMVASDIPQPDAASSSRLPIGTSAPDRPSAPSPMAPAAQAPGPWADDVPSDQLTLF